MRAGQSEHAVANWIWHDGVFDPDVQLLGQGASGPGPADCRGHFAIHQDSSAGRHLLARDRMGVNKLFFVVDAEGEVHSSNFIVDLLRAGHPISDVQSVPSGHVVHIDSERRSLDLEVHSRLRFERSVGTDESRGSDRIQAYGERVRAALDATFERLACSLRGRRVFVTLSGGLDSTTIAALAQRWLEDVTAVTFYIDDGTDPDVAGSDLSSARRVAEELGMPLELIAVSPDELLSLIDPVLVWGQDWRDFNVHCGLVNAAIANGLRETLGRSPTAGASIQEQEARPVILTGDTMNELMADYSPVSHRGRDYYSLPRLSADRLRRFLVDGLDTGDREVGIFAHYGFDTLQPYALCAEVYAALPGSLLESGHVKQDLVRSAMGDDVPAHVYARPKVRAQEASIEGASGTLATVVDRGYDSAFLVRRLAELLDVRVDALTPLIRGGFYRFAAHCPSTAPG